MVTSVVGVVLLAVPQLLPFCSTKCENYTMNATTDLPTTASLRSWGDGNCKQWKNEKEAQRPIGYGVGLRIKRSSVRIRPWPLRWVLGQGSLLPLSQGETFTLASISYLAILVKYILAKKKIKKNEKMKRTVTSFQCFRIFIKFKKKKKNQFLRSSTPKNCFPVHIFWCCLKRVSWTIWYLHLDYQKGWQVLF